MIPYGVVGMGGVTPIRDRDDQLFEAARTIGMIDFSDYLSKGRWNDTHVGYTPETKDRPPVIVGVPVGLEFHDQESPLSKAHQKVGFWTEGYLWDRHDPQSWIRAGHTPTSHELDRADHFWQLATLLKGSPRQIGFSAQGKMLVSPCGKRIIWAKVQHNAVCEVPVNPHAVAVPLNLAVPITRGMLDKPPCDDCRCPPGARCKTLTKGITADSMSPMVTEDLEQKTGDELSGSKEELKKKLRRLAELLAERTGCTLAEALKFVRTWAAAQREST